MSQSLAIQRHLAAGHSLTQLEALKRFGCLRLGARMHELKREHWPVRSEYVSVGNGKRVKRYWFNCKRRVRR
jgi:hypothetical protein